MHKPVLAAAAMALVMATAGTAQAATAIFAGGCFWSTESDFDHVKGVTETVSGFIGGHVKDPTYEQVVTTDTGHVEAVKITFDPAVVTYDQLLDIYWHSTDPTDPYGQVTDHGPNYLTGIYAMDAEQMQEAEATKAEVQKALGKPVATAIKMATAFYPAGEEHQNFHASNEDFYGTGRTRAEHYKLFRAGSGHNAVIQQVWGKDAFRGLPNHE